MLCISLQKYLLVSTSSEKGASLAPNQRHKLVQVKVFLLGSRYFGPWPFVKKKDQAGCAEKNSDEAVFNIKQNMREV